MKQRDRPSQCYTPASISQRVAQCLLLAGSLGFCAPPSSPGPPPCPHDSASALPVSKMVWCEIEATLARQVLPLNLAVTLSSSNSCVASPRSQRITLRMRSEFAFTVMSLAILILTRIHVPNWLTASASRCGALHADVRPRVIGCRATRQKWQPPD